MDELINHMVEIFSQWIGISNHHNVHFKYLTILYGNYTKAKNFLNILLFQVKKVTKPKAVLSLRDNFLKD